MTAMTEPGPTGDRTLEHPVRRKLRDQIIPWLESAKLLQKQWFYRLHVLFGYATDVTVALGAIGIALPLMTLLTQPSENPGNANTSVIPLLPQDPEWLYYLTLVCVIGWVVLRVTFNREEGQKKAVLAKSCRQTMKQAEAKLYHLLAQSDPMPELNKLIAEQITPTVDRNIQEGSWPWNGPAPVVEPAVDAQLDSLCTKFSSNWSPVDPTGIRG
jgi:hypothetical protein